jgi:hypothetical protein
MDIARPRLSLRRSSQGTGDRLAGRPCRRDDLSRRGELFEKRRRIVKGVRSEA